MRMEKQFKSISFKLTVLYVGTVLLVLAVFIAIISYYSHESVLIDAQRTMEVGPGFLNSITPEDAIGLPDMDDVSIKFVISEFTPFGDITARGEAVGNRYLLNYTITNSKETGLVTIYPDDFPATLFVGSPSLTPRYLFYKEVEGFEDVLIVASVEVPSFTAINSSGQFNSIILLFSPLVVALAVFFGVFVSIKTVAPIKKIAWAAERINEQDIGCRVQVNSSDEIGSLARSFNHMADRLENSIISRKRFISDAAHELKTPLASIKTSVTHALSGKRSLEEYQENLNFICARIETMETLINDLLFLAKADEGGITSPKGAIDISSIIAEAEEVFLPVFEDKGIKLNVWSKKDLFVSSERRLLLCLISNLLDNARLPKKSPFVDRKIGILKTA